VVAVGDGSGGSDMVSAAEGGGSGRKRSASASVTPSLPPTHGQQQRQRNGRDACFRDCEAATPYMVADNTRNIILCTLFARLHSGQSVAVRGAAALLLPSFLFHKIHL
jgi:hypothetical protein